MIGLKDEVTAITLVTFGTSQIDLFASRIAAVNDPIADNSIGNVVAANAIGVFLGGNFPVSCSDHYWFCHSGLGFPWLVASIYWEYYDPVVGFEVNSKSINFQVIFSAIYKVETIKVVVPDSALHNCIICWPHFDLFPKEVDIFWQSWARRTNCSQIYFCRVPFLPLACFYCRELFAGLWCDRKSIWFHALGKEFTFTEDWKNRGYSSSVLCDTR